jgi:type IV secretory pathway TrbD component
MAGQRSKRRSRKRRHTGSVPRAVPAQRSERRTQREVAAREDRQRKPRVDPRGERPPSLFGGVPVSEIAILAGIIAAVVGYFQGGGPALVVGVTLCALGVIEFTAREHVAGFRSHSTLLAAIPTVGVEFFLVQELPASVLPAGALAGDAIVFGLLFWLLRRRFARARQRRIARPPRA